MNFCWKYGQSPQFGHFWAGLAHTHPGVPVPFLAGVSQGTLLPGALVELGATGHPCGVVSWFEKEVTIHHLDPIETWRPPRGKAAGCGCGRLCCGLGFSVHLFLHWRGEPRGAQPWHPRELLHAQKEHLSARHWNPCSTILSLCDLALSGLRFLISN